MKRLTQKVLVTARLKMDRRETEGTDVSTQLHCNGLFLSGLKGAFNFCRKRNEAQIYKKIQTYLGGLAVQASPVQRAWAGGGLGGWVGGLSA